LNVVFQIFLLDWFLGGYFLSYGIDVATYDTINPMTKVFPKVTKCNYYKIGPSGSRVKLDALCILPLNIVNEKLFLFLWFWFTFLTVVSFYQLVYRAVVLGSAQFRSKLLKARCRCLADKHAEAITKRLSFGDMFFIDLLGRNVNPIVFRELLTSLGGALQGKNHYDADITMAV